MVDIITIFKDDGRVAANLAELDIQILCETKFAANDTFDIFEGMF